MNGASELSGIEWYYVFFFPPWCVRRELGQSDGDTETDGESDGESETGGPDDGPEK